MDLQKLPYNMKAMLHTYIIRRGTTEEFDGVSNDRIFRDGCNTVYKTDRKVLVQLTNTGIHEIMGEREEFGDEDGLRDFEVIFTTDPLLIKIFHDGDLHCYKLVVPMTLTKSKEN